MARHVDRAHLLEPEVPRRVRVEERPDEAAARAVDVQWDVQAPLLLESHEQVVDADDVVLVPGERRAQHGGDPDGVLVDVRLDVLGPDRVLAGLERHDARLDVEVPAELLPDDVHVAAEHEVRAVRRPTLGRATRAPVPLQRQRPQHDRLGRPLGTGPRRLPGRVEEVGQHPDAALLDLRRARVLGVVDEVAVQVRRDELLRLRLHPRRDERREVAGRVALQREVLGDEAHGVDRRHPRVGEGRAGHLVDDEAVAEEGGVGVGGDEGGHALLLGCRTGTCGITRSIAGVRRQWRPAPVARRGTSGRRRRRSTRRRGGSRRRRCGCSPPRRCRGARSWRGRRP